MNYLGGKSRVAKHIVNAIAPNGSETLTLEHGDLVIMSGRAQIDYQHAVLKCSKAEARINLTFRTVR